MIIAPNEKVSPRDMSSADLGRLQEIYRSVLPFGGQERHSQLAGFLADVPQRVRGLLLDRVNVVGNPLDVAGGVVVQLIRAGQPVAGREALGYFVRALGGQVVDAADREWLSGLFDRYALDAAVSGEALPGDAWRGGGLPASDYEVIVRENTLQPVYYLEAALAASRAVVRLMGATGWGTGFLVGEGLVMTCAHVIANLQDLHRTFVFFNYQLDPAGRPVPGRTVVPVADGAFFASPKTELDFALFEVRPEEVPADARPLGFRAQPAEVGERVSIVQHPGGGYKMFSMRNNLVEYADARVLQYTTSTLKGSSGAPVLDEGLRVVGVHHRGSENLVEPVSGARFARNQGSTAPAILERLAADAPELRDRLTVE
jgi:hypothetical protein